MLTHENKSERIPVGAAVQFVQRRQEIVAYEMAKRELCNNDMQQEMQFTDEWVLCCTYRNMRISHHSSDCETVPITPEYAYGRAGR